MSQYKNINENIDQIIQAINRDPGHITEYDWLIQNIHQVTGTAYQKRYKNYWRLNVARPSQNFCQVYFQHLYAGLSENLPQVGVLANQLYQTPINANRRALEFSFCTKLCHMVDRQLPIYDLHIRNFYEFSVPTSNFPVEQRIRKFLQFYQFLVDEYDKVLKHGLLSESIQAFRKRLSPMCFTDIKIIDSLIWAQKKNNISTKVML